MPQIVKHNTKLKSQISNLKSVSNKIKNLLAKGIIKESQQVISPIFLIPKTENEFRMILNLKRLNKNTPYLHFKMDTIDFILTLVSQDR